MIGIDFAYNDHKLSDFDMKMFDPEDNDQFVGREIIRSDISSVRATPNHFSAKYTDTLVLNFLIIRDDMLCFDQGDFKLSDSDIHTLRSWLEYPKLPQDLHATLDDESLSVHYYGIFTDIQPFIVAGTCYGLYLTFTCNAPYGFSDEISTTIQIESSDTDIEESVVNIEREFQEYLNPTIRIQSNDTFNGSEIISIKNRLSDETMTLTMPAGLETVVVDCQHKIITDENGQLISMNDIGIALPIIDQYNFISAEPYLFPWIRLYNGNNIMEISLSDTSTFDSIEFSTRYIIKSGGLS